MVNPIHKKCLESSDSEVKFMFDPIKSHTELHVDQNIGQVDEDSSDN